VSSTDNPDEALVALVLRFDVSQSDLIPQKRIRLLKDLTKFTQSLSKCDQCLLSLETNKDETHSAFLSGVGNINQVNFDREGVSVSWSFGCASDKIELDILDAVEKATRNDSLTEITGYNVIEWKFGNRKPYATRFKKLHRLKR